jgi:hypothetical protein
MALTGNLGLPRNLAFHSNRDFFATRVSLATRVYLKSGFSWQSPLRSPSAHRCRFLYRVEQLSPVNPRSMTFN